ncbi:MAG: hypothetical protein J5802_05470 [Butyrivibrio sp.]|nr:hypothetical protein [Butyrivibrio sp.]
MEYKKRNGFFVFCFSFVPGAVEMYMGFMKNGVSLLALFILSIAIACQGWFFFTSLFMGIAAIIYIYAFFHAWNRYRLSGEELLKMEDNYIWTEFGITQMPDLKGEKKRKAVALAMITVGGLLVYGFVGDFIMEFVPGDYWGPVHRIIRNGVPQAAVAACLILLGIKLNNDKKAELGIDTDIVAEIAADQDKDKNKDAEADQDKDADPVQEDKERDA